MPRQVHVRALRGWHDPERVFLALAADAPTAVWLDGGVDAVAGRSVIAVAHDTSRIVTADTGADPDAVLDELRGVLAAERVVGAGPSSAHERMSLGWLGWFGYEFGARRLGVPVAATETPDAAWLFADRAVVFDHGRRRVRLEWLGSDDADAWAADTAQVIGRLSRAAPDGASVDATDRGAARGASARPEPAVPTWRHDAAAYADMIRACQAAIARGDAYQLCLTNRVELDVHPDPLATYRRLRRTSPSHHGGFLRFGDVSLLSASPEQFLLVQPDGRVSTRPMKGTRPRGRTPALDEALRQELERSDKERAENLMIVDLMRNDLSRIAVLGSVHVPDLLVTETYQHVHQLVSTVAAHLREPFSAVDAVAAAFPAGSMTGAPKVSAMRILHDLERGPRGVYSGVFGSLAVDGGADLAMVIRSIVLTPLGASVGTGGGITALSQVDEEIEETRIKARAALAVLDDDGDPAPIA